MTLLFDYTGPTFIVLVIFLIFYFLKPVFITESNRFFLFIIIAEIFGFMANTVSAYVDNNISDYYKWMVIFFNNFYYIIYMVRYILFALYFSSLLQISNKKNVFFIATVIITSVVTLIVLINPWVELIYELPETGMFQTGKFVFLIYLSNLLTVILDLYYFFRFSRKLDYKDKIAILISVIILISCCIIDFFYIEYVISDIFFLLVIIILYLIFENPEIFYDKKTGILNNHAFTCSVADNLYRHKNYAVYGFRIKNYNELKELYGKKQINFVLNEIGNYMIINYSNLNCFYLENGIFSVIDKNTKSSRNVAETIQKRFDQPWKLKNYTSIQTKITFISLDKSINFESYEQMELCVEQAVVESEGVSANYIKIDEKLFKKVLRNSKILKALNKALAENSILVYFQPIIDAKSRKIVGAEALSRIYDNELGIIFPGEFISIAEKNGYIEKLGEQVLNKVCKLWREIDFLKYGVQWINVNLSPIQCLNMELLSNINRSINKNNIKPEYIHLEITEESMIDKQILNTQINNLIANGYFLSLDDFGSGFSNLYLIKAFPFSNIKLDISLINEHFNSPDNMLPRIVQIFKERDLTVTAEGVETEEMANELEKMGCDYLQGYYFSKPVPENDFLKMIGCQGVAQPLA